MKVYSLPFSSKGVWQGCPPSHQYGLHRQHIMTRKIYCLQKGYKSVSDSNKFAIIVDSYNRLSLKNDSRKAWKMGHSHRLSKDFLKDSNALRNLGTLQPISSTSTFKAYGPDALIPGNDDSEESSQVKININNNSLNPIIFGMRDSSDCNNYRGISLINNCISKYGIDKGFIGPEHYGFHKRRRRMYISLYTSLRIIYVRDENLKIYYLDTRGERNSSKRCPLSPIFYLIWFHLMNIFNYCCHTYGISLGDKRCCGGLFADDIISQLKKFTNLLKFAGKWARNNEIQELPKTNLLYLPKRMNNKDFFKNPSIPFPYKTNVIFSFSNWASFHIMHLYFGLNKEGTRSTTRNEKYHKLLLPFMVYSKDSKELLTFLLFRGEMCPMVAQIYRAFIGFRWVLHARCGYKFDTRVAKAAKMIEEDYTVITDMNNIELSSDSDSSNKVYNINKNNNRNNIVNNSRNSDSGNSIINISNSENYNIVTSNVVNSSIVENHLNYKKEWNILFKNQIISGDYSKTPFLVRSAALLTEIMPRASTRQGLLFRKYKRKLTRSVNAETKLPLRQANRANICQFKPKSIRR
ncbi:hypothetical protein H8356DRAFT_1422948 [Neocallimastix lanati (nom. inval.)]|nr:hypothetical protein H8356DRAFT_1422948 [Neocallimastix sp. JGI-2020a]